MPTLSTRVAPFLCFVLAIGLGNVPVAAEAQVRVTGQTVTAEEQRPISGVAVTIVDSAGDDLEVRLTDEAGAFAFLVEEATSIRLRAGRIGYATVFTPPVDLERFRSLTVEIRLSPEVVPVAPLEIVAGRQRSTSPVHSGFHDRKERGFGQYITREEIEKRNPSRVTDLLRSVPGVRTTSSGRGSHGVVTTSRGNNSFAGQCPAQIYVDDFHVNRANGWTFRIDDVVSPDDVEGIEVYRGLATVPAQFLSPQADCGVIAIWTRRSPG